ncbi:enoyl-CoA hydratase [Alcanivorax nanhaiticus]|uniref:3-hydroxyisobutyryl-CoA hydrolase n=1 Tax=Alcanivorax nanhaiticus TaxID=1177154 RepID=A0A095SH02_9GAMM|nr:enoyl-CoA hydratase/isomerase family protein [Alcanivorax nanhaiticus]KGD63832.1 enoyl-CoA hydratase [Alcanivorax nanhaiticus]
MSDCVLFSEIPTACGRVIARATLNAPKALNALGLDMIQALAAKLDEWEQREDIVALWLDGAGGKAFCAGGDIVQMHKSMVKHAGEGRNPFTEQYFAEEYALDYRLHRSQIPVVVFGDGIVMGGGMGLLQGADFRLVTARSRMAMPEITIGLFPDVGGSWFLNRLPGKVGLFLGLTGVHINGREAVEVGLADRMVEGDAEALLALLAEQRYSGQPRDNRAVLYRLFKQQAADMAELPHPLVDHLSLINSLCDGEDLQTVVTQMLSAKDRDSWLDRALGNLEKGCPQTAHLVWEQLARSTYLSLADVFRMEWCLAVQCSLHGDFREGVRALLIDKDGKPGFRHRSIADVPRDYIDGYFECPAPVHPLASLGKA